MGNVKVFLPLKVLKVKDKSFYYFIIIASYCFRTEANFVNYTDYSTMIYIHAYIYKYCQIIPINL